MKIAGTIVPLDNIGAAILKLAVDGWELEGETLNQKALSRLGMEGLRERSCAHDVGH